MKRIVLVLVVLLAVAGLVLGRRKSEGHHFRVVSLPRGDATTTHPTRDDPRHECTAVEVRMLDDGSLLLGEIGLHRDSSPGITNLRLPVGRWKPAVPSAAPELASLETWHSAKLISGVGRRVSVNFTPGDGFRVQASGKTYVLPVDRLAVGASLSPDGRFLGIVSHEGGATNGFYDVPGVYNDVFVQIFDAVTGTAVFEWESRRATRRADTVLAWTSTAAFVVLNMEPVYKAPPISAGEARQVLWVDL